MAAPLERCPRCGRRGYLGLTGTGPACYHGVAEATPWHQPRSRPVPDAAVVDLGGYAVVLERESVGAADNGSDSPRGLVVATSVSRTRTLVAGPWPELHRAQAELLALVGAYPTPDEALANRHRWDRTVRA